MTENASSLTVWWWTIKIGNVYSECYYLIIVKFWLGDFFVCLFLSARPICLSDFATSQILSCMDRYLHSDRSASKFFRKSKPKTILTIKSAEEGGH